MRREQTHAGSKVSDMKWLLPRNSAQRNEKKAPQQPNAIQFSLGHLHRSCLDAHYLHSAVRLPLKSLLHHATMYLY